MILMARRASCHVANAFFNQIKANLAEIQPQNHQNVQNLHFWQKFPRVNRLSYCEK